MKPREAWPPPSWSSNSVLHQPWCRPPSSVSQSCHRLYQPVFIYRGVFLKPAQYRFGTNCFGIPRSKADRSAHWRRDAFGARWPSCRLCPCGPCGSWCQRAVAPAGAVVACVPNRPAWPGWLACRLSVLARRAKWHAGTLRQELTVKCRII